MTNRRHFIAGAVASLASLSGCSLFRQPAEILCYAGPQFTDENARLIIDPHAHVFNGTDLQVKDFFNLVACRQIGTLGSVCALFGGVLQGLVWKTAPTAASELEKLQTLRAQGGLCINEKTSETRLSALRDASYLGARSELQTAARNRLPRGVSSQEDAISLYATTGNVEALGAAAIFELPPTREQYDKGIAMEPRMLTAQATLGIDVRSALDFVIEMFQYRISSVNRYFTQYGSNDLKIDLITPSIVDFDWPLSKGERTKSSLKDQFFVMREICILTGGRVHPIVPFDPFREVAARLGREESLLPFIKEAVTSGVAVGIKLYPPMGFGPTLNCDLAAGFWQREWSSDIVTTPGFGAMLDSALDDLYFWCSQRRVPIISHANVSNGPSEEFEQLVAPTRWQGVVDTYPQLAINLGHLGGVGSGSTRYDWEGYLALMQSSGPGARVFADASYFSDALESGPDATIDLLRRLIERQPLVTDRLNYGSDWKMLALESGSERYLALLAKAAQTIDAGAGGMSFGERFVGGNAASWLGLDDGDGNRGRMLAFYDDNGIAHPPWTRKVAGI